MTRDFSAPRLPPSREEQVLRLADLASPDVLIIGGGVNGVATLRDLALNGVRAVLVEQGGFRLWCKRRINPHGAWRPALSRRTGIQAGGRGGARAQSAPAPRPAYREPFGNRCAGRIRSRGGLFRAGLRFTGLSGAAGPLSLAALKVGLACYEFFGRAERALPPHRVLMRRDDFPRGLPATTRAVVSYFDGRIDTPEALIFEMLAEAEAQARRGGPQSL